MTSQTNPVLQAQTRLFPPEIFAWSTSEHFLHPPSTYDQKKVLAHLHSWAAKMAPSPPSAITGQGKHSCAKVTIEFFSVHVQEGIPFVDIEKVKPYGHSHLLISASGSSSRLKGPITLAPLHATHFKDAAFPYGTLLSGQAHTPLTPSHFKAAEIQLHVVSFFLLLRYFAELLQLTQPVIASPSIFFRIAEVLPQLHLPSIKRSGSGHAHFLGSSASTPSALTLSSHLIQPAFGDTTNI